MEEAVLVVGEAYVYYYGFGGGGEALAEEVAEGPGRFCGEGGEGEGVVYVFDLVELAGWVGDGGFGGHDRC